MKQGGEEGRERVDPGLSLPHLPSGRHLSEKPDSREAAGEKETAGNKLSTGRCISGQERRAIVERTRQGGKQLRRKDKRGKVTELGKDTATN